MNAKNTMRLLEKCAADAGKHFPDDIGMRARFFVATLSTEFKLVGEPLGDRLAEIVSPKPGCGGAA